MPLFVVVPATGAASAAVAVLLQSDCCVALSVPLKLSAGYTMAADVAPIQYTVNKYVPFTNQDGM